MAKNSKKEYSGNEVTRYIGAVKEHFEDGMKAIGEQYFDLKNDISGLKTGVASLKTDMTIVKQTLDSHTKTLDSHTEILNSHTEMIGQLMVDVTEIKNDLKQKVGLDQFAKLEKRVARLEIKSA